MTEVRFPGETPCEELFDNVSRCETRIEMVRCLFLPARLPQTVGRIAFIPMSTRDFQTLLSNVSSAETLSLMFNKSVLEYPVF